MILEPPAHAPFPPDMLAGEVALVTGGGSGLGRGMALALAQAGACVAVLGRDRARAESGVEAITEAGGTAMAVTADVRDESAIESAFAAAETAFGPVSILANNAGGNFPVLAEKMSANAWNSVTRIAVDGTYLCSAVFARRRAGRQGAIVNNSAQYIHTGFPGDSHSASAKAAVAGMTGALAREWPNIRVNCIAAGFFPHAATGSGDGPEAVAQLGAMIPAGRTGRMRELGWLAAFLCSPLAKGISGETLFLDGGESLRYALLSPEFRSPRARANVWDYK